MIKQLKPEDVWEAPDWAPDDTGDTLFTDGKWITVRDYRVDTRESTVATLHMCRGEPWVLRRNPAQLVNGACNECGAKAPDRVKGFDTMLKWAR